MNINTIKWANKEHSALLINGNTTVPWPCSIWLNTVIQAWFEAGNTPEPYETLDEAKVRKHGEIKADAYERITAILPEWKQRNTLARVAELQEARSAAPLTSAEQAELDGYMATWGDIKAIREASNTADAEVDAATTIDEVEAVSW